MTPRRTETIDEQAIRALARYLEQAWNRGDGFSYAALFTEDCDYIAFDGTHLTSRQANARHHDELFDSALYGSRLRLTDITVRFVTADLALMHANGSVSMPWQAPDSAKRRSLHTYVVVRNDDGWRIAASQSVRVQPIAMPRGLPLRLLRGFVRLRTMFTARSLEPAGGW